MQVKRYEVSSIHEAMTKIKKDLGADAIILSTRKIRSGRQDMFEVMAARDENPDRFENALQRPAISRKACLALNTPQDPLALIRRELQDIKESILVCQSQNPLAGELAEIKETMSSFFDVLGMRKGRLPQDINSKIYLQLLGNGFSRASACRIVDAVNQKTASAGPINETQAMAVAAKHIGTALTDFGENACEKRIKMFIGPTGVGKTTTLAKLAARYSITKDKTIGLISTDNFRIAAAEQLGTYARIMGLQMERASTKESFGKALKTFADRDIILVDTPGRARPDDGYIHQLEQALPDHHSIEKNLLINATGSEDYVESILSGYSHLGIDNLIVTKIDESRRCGMLFEMITKAKKPVRYVTCGQNVPQDIEEVTPALMANLMLRRTPPFADDRPKAYASSSKE